MEPSEIHLHVLREMADKVTKPLSIIFEKLWQSGEVPGEWKKGDITLIFKNGKAKDLGIYRPVSLPSIHRKIMEQILLETVLRHVKNKEMIGDSQHSFTKGKSCLTNFVTFCDGFTALVDGIEQQMSSTWTYAKHLTLSPKWRHGFDGWTIQWIVK
ncbi:hypothetical protein BTVI_35960 [Pitangus sulphuratus]|nr:hypothetical protein BTVI_35960 [Pitangus sulphuratus]